MCNRGGGIAIYLQKGLQYKILFKYVPSDPVEYIGMDFKGVNISKCMIICVYNCMDKVFEEINKHLLYKYIIVCGDINIDLHKSGQKTEKFPTD